MPVPSLGVGRAPDARRRRGCTDPLQVQVFCLGVAFLVGLVTLAATTVLTLSAISRETRRENEVLLPAHADLHRAAQRFGDVNLDTPATLAEVSPTERLPALAALIPRVNRANEAWRHYERASIGLPDEAALEAEVVEARARATDLGTAAFASSDLAVPDFDELVRRVEAQRDAFTVFGERYQRQTVRASASVGELTLRSRVAPDVGIAGSGVLLLGGTVHHLEAG